MRRLALIVLSLCLSGVVFATTIEAYHFDDPAKEARYKNLIEELRCLVCQNQNLADSNAELAQDMRRLTYEMVQQGNSEEDIVTFMVQRYGDFVMYRPPFRRSTALLWVGPFIILGVGLLILVIFIRRRNSEPAPKLSRDEHERARHLLEDDEENGS
jgi:cytochrome c-type biogenesis protein CcmH